MTKTSKKGPAFLLKTYDMLDVQIFSYRNKSSSKLLTGIKMEMALWLRILMNCHCKSYQSISNIQTCIHSLDN